MRSKIFFFTLIILLTTTVAGFGLWWQYSQFIKTPINLSEERVFTISEGSNARKVIADLHKLGIIDNPWNMRIFFESKTFSKRLQSGTFVLKPPMNPEDLGEALTRSGKYFERNVQISAGMNIYEIAERMHQLRIADRKIFLQKARDESFVKSLSIPANSIEAYIAAGKYHFKPTATVEEIIAEMHEAFLKRWAEIVNENRGKYEQYQRQGFGDHELLTLASIVEKEAVKDREKPVITRVFLNRIRLKMPLQSDPTCVYPPIKLGEKPSPKRCKDKSNPYSTYIIKGLPPGPITTISDAGLLALFSPYEGTDARELLYFVAKNDGSYSHYFSKTYKEHQVAIKYYLKKEKVSPPKQTKQP